MNNLISIIMPAYNAAQYIGAAITSILNQTYNQFELIIVDDGSTDNTADVVGSFKDSRIILIKNPRNYKLPRSLNIAIDAAKGSYIARSDADDINMPTRLQKQIEYLGSHPEVDVVGTGMYIFNPEQNILGGIGGVYAEHEELIKRIHWRTPLAHATIMAKADWLRLYKYSENYPRAEDYELFLRSYQCSRFANIPEFLYAVRDPGTINFKKMLASNRDNLAMLWRNRRRYGLSAHHPVFLLGIVLMRFIYYGMASLSGRSFFWAHCRQVEQNENFIGDRKWIEDCLRS